MVDVLARQHKRHQQILVPSLSLTLHAVHLALLVFHPTHQPRSYHHSGLAVLTSPDADSPPARSPLQLDPRRQASQATQGPIAEHDRGVQCCRLEKCDSGFWSCRQATQWGAFSIFPSSRSVTKSTACPTSGRPSLAPGQSNAEPGRSIRWGFFYWRHWLEFPYEAVWLPCRARVVRLSSLDCRPQTGAESKSASLLPTVGRKQWYLPRGSNVVNPDNLNLWRDGPAAFVASTWTW